MLKSTLSASFLPSSMLYTLADWPCALSRLRRLPLESFRREAFDVRDDRLVEHVGRLRYHESLLLSVFVNVRLRGGPYDLQRQVGESQSGRNMSVGREVLRMLAMGTGGRAHRSIVKKDGELVQALLDELIAICGRQACPLNMDNGGCIVQLTEKVE